MPRGYSVPRTNPTKKTTIRVKDFVVDDDGRLLLVTHLSDRAIAAKTFDGKTVNASYDAVKRVKSKPLWPGVTVKKGKREFVVVKQAFSDAVLVRDASGAEHEVSPRGLRVVKTARYARPAPKTAFGLSTPPAAAVAPVVSPAASRGMSDDTKHDMTPVIAVHGNGDEDRIGFAWTAAEADKLLRRFKFAGRAARAQMRDGEKVYIGPVGDTQFQLDKAIYELAHNRKLSSRPNPSGRKNTTMATAKKKSRAKSGRKAKRSPAQIAATKKMLAANKRKRSGQREVKKLRSMGKKARKNPVRTASGRVLEARGGKKAASRLLLLRKAAIERGETPPNSIPLPGGRRLTYESAQFILQGRGISGSRKGSKPRKARETSGRSPRGSGSGPDLVTYINKSFGRRV